MTQILRARRISKTYGTTKALDELSLSIHAGEVTCVLGDSGCGKTTLLRCLNLLDYIDAGFIEYGGHRVLEVPEASDAEGRASRRRRRPVLHVNEDHYRRKFGVVLPSGGLHPNQTVLENVVEIPLRVLRQSRKEITRLATELLKAVGLSERVSAHPCDLTLVERRCVALARALAMKPEVLLIDEVTTGLYPPEAARMLETVTNVRSFHNAATVMVTHHLAFAKAVADKICFMDRGDVVEHGPADRLLAQPASDRLRSYLATVRSAA